jgi:tungstate transport system ATP-binding protein
MTTASFSFHDIRKGFHHKPLLAIDKFTLQQGRCTALIGSNGAGKTTLLKIMAGLEHPQQAWVSRDGAAARPWKQARQRLRREVVYLHQFAYMFDTSVGENVGYGLACNGLPRRQRRERIRAALSQVGLSHLSDAAAKTLSGGERQRIALARALVLEPTVLLLDEPTASMDQQAREQMVPLLEQLTRRGLCTVIVTHDIATLGDFPDTCLELCEGSLRVVFENRDSSAPLHRPSSMTAAPLPRWGTSHG